MEEKDAGKTDRDDASKAPPASTGSQEIEARILEEHVVAPATPAPTPITAPQPAATLSAPVPAQNTIVSNISSLLGKIKLPTRTSEETPKKTYDTALSIDPARKASPDAAQQQALQQVSAAARNITESLPTKIPTSSDDVRALHTLKDDLQTVVRDKKISLVRAVALEEEKRHLTDARETQVAEITARRGNRMRSGFLFIVMLVAVGLLALGAIFFVMSARAVRPTQVSDQLLFAEQATQLPLDNLAAADVKRSIASARNSGALTLGAITQIVPTLQKNVGGTLTTAPATFAEFLTAIGASQPELSRALSDQFFFGLHTVDENAPLIVVSVTSYERAFAAMLAWEKTMNQDLSPIFMPVAMQTVGPDGVLVERAFTDTVMNNYDVRALKDESGTIQLYYAFPTRDLLIIAESPYSFAEILSRLRADRRL